MTLSFLRMNIYLLVICFLVSGEETIMKKAEVIEKLQLVKEHALHFLKQKHTRWNKNDPLGLAEANLKAFQIVEGVDFILSEIEFISDDKEFELLRKGEFEKYLSIANLLKREDIKDMAENWKELFGNIENMFIMFDEPVYKMAELSIYEAPSVYVIYIAKI